ncbi:MAG: CoA-binding protein [Alphaproteobacteria bacterium]|jgi:predicted CoA-binding protein|nr:CoA-binding protein [Alphaproteobacteria bacterium]
MSASDDDAHLARILSGTKTIAVVGASTDWERPSCRIMQYLQAMGYRIYPVNPNAVDSEILGRQVYGSLADIEEAIDLVDVFRRSDAVAGIVDDAIAVGAKAIWLQKGVRDDAAAAKALDAGLDVVADRCIKTEHFRLLGGPDQRKVDSRSAAA